MVIEEDEPLGRAMIRGCMRMYSHPTQAMRDQVAAELATFFPLEEQEEEKPPPPKKEEQQAQQEAEQEETEHAQYLDKMETGIDSDVVTEGRVQYHDHTATVRRPSMRIARRAVPVSRGVGLRFPHRYFLDKAIFAQRLLTEAGIMIDGSGSMSWTDEDMKVLMNRLPAVRIGLYSGVEGQVNSDGKPIVGRICILAKNGRFARFDGMDPGTNEGNDVDLEALQLLATWPRPRFWLSDGFVCGGLHGGPPQNSPATGYYNTPDGRIHELCNLWMKRHDILRVPNRETMIRLIERKKVRLYRTTTPHDDDVSQLGSVASQFPVSVEPVLFQL
jgi:hypothetical protein